MGEIEGRGGFWENSMHCVLCQILRPRFYVLLIKFISGHRIIIQYWVLQWGSFSFTADWREFWEQYWIHLNGNPGFRGGLSFYFPLWNWCFSITLCSFLTRELNSMHFSFIVYLWPSCFQVLQFMTPKKGLYKRRQWSCNSEDSCLVDIINRTFGASIQWKICDHPKF